MQLEVVQELSEREREVLRYLAEMLSTGEAGCLGHEPATEYDMHLKLGGFYEAR